MRYAYFRNGVIVMLVISSLAAAVSCSKMYKVREQTSEDSVSSSSVTYSGNTEQASSALEQQVRKAMNSSGVDIKKLKVICDLTKVQVKPFDLLPSECKEVCIAVNATDDIQTCYAVILPQELSCATVKAKIEEFVSQREEDIGQPIKYTALEAGDYLIFIMSDKAADFSTLILESLSY